MSERAGHHSTEMELASLLLDIVDGRLTEDWQGFTLTFKAKTQGSHNTLDRLTLVADDA